MNRDNILQIMLAPQNLKAVFVNINKNNLLVVEEKHVDCLALVEWNYGDNEIIQCIEGVCITHHNDISRFEDFINFVCYTHGEDLKSNYMEELKSTFDRFRDSNKLKVWPYPDTTTDEVIEALIRSGLCQ